MQSALCPDCASTQCASLAALSTGFEHVPWVLSALSHGMPSCTAIMQIATCLWRFMNVVLLCVLLRAPLRVPPSLIFIRVLLIVGMLVFVLRLDLSTMLVLVLVL